MAVTIVFVIVVFRVRVRVASVIKVINSGSSIIMIDYFLKLIFNLVIAVPSFCDGIVVGQSRVTSRRVL